MLKLICATKCSNIHMHPQIHTKTVYTSLLPLLSYVVRHCCTWREALQRLKWPLGVGGIYTLPFLPNCTLPLLPHFNTSKIEPELSLSPFIVDLKPPSKSIDFPINPWGKRIQNSIREQLHWFPNSKEHLVNVLASGCVCYSWSLAPGRLERHPWSLPTCVAAPEGL